MQFAQWDKWKAGGLAPSVTCLAFHSLVFRPVGRSLGATVELCHDLGDEMGVGLCGESAVSIYDRNLYGLSQ